MRVESLWPAGVTPVSDIFIDQYMAAANGEFVKTYLLLLRLSGRQDFSLSDLADRLQQTEGDVRRALKYWEKEGLLALKETEGEPVSLRLKVPENREEKPAREPVPAVTEKAEEAPGEKAGPAPAGLGRRSYSGEKMQKLRENQDFSQLLFVVEHYFGRPLTPRDQDIFAYLYDELGFPGEVLEYLVEYCVEIWEREEKKKDHHLMRYLESVALKWHAAGAVTLPLAKRETAMFTENNAFNRTVSRELGLKNRQLTPGEEKYISTWLYEMNMPRELVLEACRRSVRSKNGPDFKYMDGIISSWKKASITTMEQVAAADEAHRKNSISSGRKEKPAAASGTDYRSQLQQVDYAALLKK